MKLINQKPFALLTVFFFLIITLGYIISYSLYFKGHIDLLTAFLCNIVLGYLVFTPLHEASHGNIAGSNSDLKWLDKIIGEISGALLFAPFLMFKILHLRHHSRTNDKKDDPDYWVANKSIILTLLSALTIMPHYYYNAIFNPTSRIKSELKKTLMIKAVMIVLVVIVCIVTNDLSVLVLWPLSAIMSFFILALVFDWLPHHPYKSTERYYDTRIFNYSFLTPFLLFQNYHLIHHLYPRIPWYRYKKAFIEIESDLRERKVSIVE